MEKRLVIIVPSFNEEGNIQPIYEEVTRVFETLAETYKCKLLFVDDGSTDASVERIESIQKIDHNVDSIQLSRNFGKEIALSAGIAHADSDADAVIMMDADLQHPPSIIKQFIAEWENGADVVIGVRRRNPDEGIVRWVLSRMFSRLMQSMGNVESVAGATDFRLIDKAVVEEFNRFTEHERMTRGLIDWLGFKRAYVPFNAHARHTGTARYSYSKLMRLAFSAILAHSFLPLRFATYLGLPITIFAGGLGLFMIIEMFVLGDPLTLLIPGTAMLATMILFISGILLISIGLMTLYIEKIHQESMNRPLFVIRRRRSGTIQTHRND